MPRIGFAVGQGSTRTLVLIPRSYGKDCRGSRLRRGEEHRWLSIAR